MTKRQNDDLTNFSAVENRFQNFRDNIDSRFGDRKISFLSLKVIISTLLNTYDTSRSCVSFKTF